eukprot:CAMPEP_0119013550 /NCGR_PEP_ID=MMETSP1176-20130426/8509_1 /TAXON_ID=265551 /ORGANISM="Synedropsis recta cf, Strain CCMP1620" /LENGTH=444 /DNA_ID=CAMNT_0006966647 /DNA_START=64 /DNA_END=1394 /DNA_ORIENTATION=-
MASTDTATTTNGETRPTFADTAEAGAAKPAAAACVKATTPTNKGSNSTVDSALLSAMRDPRERVALLKCEQAMMDFCKQSDVSEIDVGGSYNSIIIGLNTNSSRQTDGAGRQTSFQRCWLHRLADRFEITRESISPEWIRCKKTPRSAIPSQLLIDLQPSEYNMGDEEASRLTGVMNNLALNGGTNGTSKKKRPQKMKIMKRSSSSSLASNKDGGKPSRSTNQGGSLDDREKAYAEARARIFNDDAAVVDSASSSALVQDTTISDGAGKASPPNGEAVTQQVLSPQTTEEQRYSSWQVPSAAASTSNTTAGMSSSASNNAASSGVSSSKVTWRNRQQEENDPDFRRGVGVVYSQQQQQQYQQQQAFVGYHPQQAQQQQQYHPQHAQQQYQQQPPVYFDQYYSYNNAQQQSDTSNGRRKAAGSGQGEGYQSGTRSKDNSKSEEFP